VASEGSAAHTASPGDFLESLILETRDVEEFLAEFARFAAHSLSRGGKG
jgi:hypothetical protein